MRRDSGQGETTADSYAAHGGGSLRERIHAARMDVLIRQCPVGAAMHVVNSMVLAGVLGWIGDTPLLGLGLWLGSVWALAAMRLMVWYRCRGRPPSPSAASFAGGMLTAIMTATGVLWGLAVLYAFTPDSIALQGFIVFLIAGMSAGSVATLGSYLPAFNGFLLCAILPLVFRLLQQGDSLHIVLGLMGLFYVGILIAAARNIHRALTQLLKLQFQRERLIGDLKAQRTKSDAANKAKTSFLALISHELRTPLNAIMGYADLLSGGAHGPLGHPRYREYVGHVYNSGAHLLGLIDELLDVSTAEAGRIEVHDEILDVPEMLEDCLALVARRAAESGIVLERSIDPVLPRLRADGRRFRQIVLNVLSNAIEFTPRGGRVDLRALLDDEGRLLVAVKDTGIGMAASDVPTALGFFNRVDEDRDRRHEGTGIGLPLTDILLKLHGGTLKIDSEVGAGTTVTMAFPAERVERGRQYRRGSVA